VTSKTIICDTEHVIAIEQDLGGDSVVITFNEMKRVRNGLRFCGDAIFLEQGISAFGIVTPRPSWYPRRAMDEVIAALLERIKGRRVVTYGHNQGGYGALKFSARLRASAALSFCPQWSINPADVASFDPRFARHFDEALGNGLRIEQQDLCDNAYIFWDRTQKMDSANAAKLAGLVGVKTIVAPFSVHDTIRLAAVGNRTATLINLCTREMPPAASDLRQVIRASRGQSKAYLNAMLRQLLLRMGHSRSRSSVFISRVLAKANNDNPLYSALINHAQGHVSLAIAELARTTARHFANVDLVLLWQASNKLRFVRAELALAVQICATLPANTGACLGAVSTLIRVANLEGAHRELARLAKHGDAAKHIDRFVEFAVKLRKPEVVEALLSDALPRSARVSVQLGLVNAYRRLGDRPNAFQKLLALVQNRADSAEDLRAVADSFDQLGEVAYAVDIRKRLLRSTPGDHLLALDVLDAEARIPLDKMRAYYRLKKLHSELDGIMRVPDLPAAVWERASHVYEQLGDVDSALRAIRKALGARAGRAGAQQRLAALLARKGLTRSARQELAALLPQCRQDPSRLRVLGGLAVNLPDWQLALQFAEAQFQCEPTDPEGILYFARHLRMAGDRDRAQSLLASLFHAERRSPSISSEQWLQLAQELYDVGDSKLTKEAVTEVLAREPNSEAARTLAASTVQLEKLRKTGAVAPPRGNAPRPGFVSRLVKIFRR